MYLFFDIDDTLLDSSTAEHQAALEFARSYPEVLGPDPQAFATNWHQVSMAFYARWTCGELAFLEQRRGRIRHYWGEGLTDIEADRIFGTYLAQYERYWTAFADALPCLQALQAFPLAVITNGEPSQQRAKLQVLGMTAYFSHVITPAEAGQCKPHSAIFSYAADKVKAQPEECVYIGDLLDADAQAAGAAGWHGVWLNRTDLAASAYGVTVISTLLELPDVIKRLLTQLSR